MDLAKRYRIDKDKIMYRVIDGEVVILNLNTGDSYSLNEVGTRIWQAIIEENKYLSGILSCLKKEYDISEKQLEKDILKLVSELEENELIRNV